MNISNAEELINTLNPNIMKCKKCKKWFFKDEPSDNYIKLFDVCIKCYRKKFPKFNFNSNNK